MKSSLWVIVVSGNGTTVVFVEGLLILSNAYDEKVQIFEIIESIKHRRDIGDLFGLKKIFSYISIPDKYPKPCSTFYISLV